MASKKRAKELWLGVAWGGGVAVVIALLALIAASSVIARWAVIALGCIGFISFSCAAFLHGWFKAPVWVGVPLRAAIVFAVVGGVMFLLCWGVWPPIRRHSLDDYEKASFEKPLQAYSGVRERIQIACPQSDEKTCVYAAQFINLFREAGWKVVDNDVERGFLGTPMEGTVFFKHTDSTPDPDNGKSGAWTRLSPSLIAVCQSFVDIGVEPESGARKDVPEDVIVIYFGSERDDESKPTMFTKTLEKTGYLKRKGSLGIMRPL